MKPGRLKGESVQQPPSYPSVRRLHPPPTPGSLGWLCPAFRGRRLSVGCPLFGVFHKHLEYNSNSASPSGASGGTLVPPWTCAGTIEPPQTTVFDQPHLSSSLNTPLRRRLCVLVPTVSCRQLPGAAQVRTWCVSRNNLWLRHLRSGFGFFAVFDGMGGVAFPTARPFLHRLTVASPEVPARPAGRSDAGLEESGARCWMFQVGCWI